MILKFILFTGFLQQSAGECVTECTRFWFARQHCDDCSKYVMCSLLGNTLIKSCPPGLQWNDFWKRCVDPSISTCQNGTDSKYLPLSNLSVTVTTPNLIEQDLNYTTSTNEVMKTPTSSQKVTEAWCPFVPVWFEIVVTSTDNAYSSVIYYSCKTGFTFSDGSTVKRTKCSALKRWVPDFVACEVKESVQKDEAFTTPVEAKYAQTIGSAALLFLIFEAVILFISDIPVFKTSLQNLKMTLQQLLNKSSHRTEEIV